MDIINLFEEMIADPNIEVQEFAARAQEIKAYFEHNLISQEEYQELADDLLELRTINKEMLSLDVQKKLTDFANALKTLKFFLTIV